jgi:hypothetical protein
MFLHTAEWQFEGIDEDTEYRGSSNLLRSSEPVEQMFPLNISIRNMTSGVVQGF